MKQPPMDDRMVAGVDMIGRTGAMDFQIRYCEEEQPVVWIAVATYLHRHPLTKRSATHYAVAAGMDPTGAIMKLCEDLIDGGECQHCHRPTIFVAGINTEHLDELGCVYAWDPELKKFRRDCEGDT